LALRAVVVTLLLGLATSGCGGSDSSDGNLCQKCGSDVGVCMPSNVLTGDQRPSGCGSTDPCTVTLVCQSEVDSPAHHCYPNNPDGTRDLFYRCDGTRPAA
jgi:hypothetical protein